MYAKPKYSKNMIVLFLQLNRCRVIESCSTYHNTVEYEAKESVVYKVAPSPKIQLYKMSDSEDIGKDIKTVLVPLAI